VYAPEVISPVLEMAPASGGVETALKEEEPMRLQESTGSPTAAYVEVDGIRIRYKTAGTGEQVLLLHGWGGSIESMELIFHDCARHYAVVAVDLPGHGGSGLPPKAWSVSDYAEMVLRLMDALGVRRPHVIAHSFGGRVTIKLAVGHPDRVGKIVLVDSAGVRPPRSLKYSVRVACATLGRCLAKHCGSAGEHARRLMYRIAASKDYANAGPLRETFVKIVNEDLTPLLPSVRSPTLLVWGEDDQDTPVSSAGVMQALIPDAKLIILKNAGHFSYLDQFGKFRLIVGRFLRA
jgi:pimeloyl-ACP methyl ester carboxylesterase